MKLLKIAGALAGAYILFKLFGVLATVLIYVIIAGVLYKLIK